MKKVRVEHILVLFSLILGFTLVYPRALVAGPIIVGNGGGSSEFYIFYSQTQAERWFTLCAGVKECRQGVEATLSDILKRRPFESRILMKSRQQLGERLFQTEPRIGADIWINQDLLWTQTENRLEALDLSAILRLLLQAWGYQLGKAVSLDAIERLTLQLTELISEDFLRTPWASATERNLSLVQTRSLPDLLFIEDRSANPAAVSRQVSLGETVDCASLSQGESIFPQQTAVVTKASQFRWLNTVRSNGRDLIPVTTKLEFSCQNSVGKSESFIGTLTLFLPYQASERTYHVTDGEIQVLLRDIR